MDYNAMTREDLLAQKRYPIAILPDAAALYERAARILADLLIERNAKGLETSAILPVGPLDYAPFARICSKEKISLECFSVFMMDEYLDEQERPIPESHPLSFLAFIRQSLLSRLDPALGFSEQRLYFPWPERQAEITDRILGMGGVDLCFGGMGLTGHFAFNDPPEPGTTGDPLNWVRESRARTLVVSRESCAQMVMGGTHGNWDILPRRACTLGMKELLASKRIVLTFMRDWHAGVLRRALFGPVSADCPGSLIQELPRVEVLMTELAARPPLVKVQQDSGE